MADQLLARKDTGIGTETVVAELVVGHKVGLVDKSRRTEIFEQLRTDDNRVLAVPSVAERRRYTHSKYGARFANIATRMLGIVEVGRYLSVEV